MKGLSSKKISTLALVLLITGTIDSIRNLPPAALFGPSLIFFFILSALIFLIPIALVSAELSSTWSEEEGGVYSWVRHAFGANMAFLTIWLQWVNTMVWYPTFLSFIAGTFAYLLNPALGQNVYYLIATILIVFWLLTGLGLRGIHASTRVAGFCAMVGMIIPMIVIISLAVLWLVRGEPLAISLNLHSILPQWQDKQSWISLTAIMTSFLGVELAAVHVRDVDNPQRNFPRAMFFSVILILVTMIFGSLAIAFVLPAHQINLIEGIMQAFTNFFAVYHLMWLLPIMTILLLIGSLGSMINWIISPAKGLLLAANHGFLPQWLYRLNKHGVASHILVLQAVIVTLMCATFLLLPSINAIYWFFTALSTELYVMMYFVMFIAAIRLKHKFPHLPRPFAIPGGKWGFYFVCFLGLIGCIITLIIGFFPPEQAANVGSANRYRLIFGFGILIMIFPALIFYKRRQKEIARAD